MTLAPIRDWLARVRWLALGHALGLTLLAITGAHAQSASSASTAPAVPPVYVIPIRGAISPASASFAVHGIEHASKHGAQLIVIEMDTPGGLDKSMRDIIQSIIASPVPVATYVYPGGARAASAGTYILYASHIAAMAPGTNLGAASPVAIGIGGPKPEAGPAPASAPSSAPAAEDTMTRKQMHDASAYIRGLAQLRHRNANWGERAVREAVSLSADEAVAQHVADLIAADLPVLLRQVDGKRIEAAGAMRTLHTAGAPVVTLEPDWRSRLLAVITDPSVALILMMIGIYGLIFEFSTPGMVVPGIAGAICLLLGLFALQMLPVNYAGLALIALGVGCMTAELFLPTFGALGVGGIIAFAFGAVMLIDTDVPGFGVPLSLIATLSTVSAVFLFGMSMVLLRARRRPVVSGADALVGSIGVVIDDAPADGWATVHGEQWRIHSAAPLVRGQRVRVTARRGLVLDVTTAGDPS
ncbi:membrane-bound serine protease (ClpP class) [Cupriavidus metallidurans]|jgi:membrane-bound serine protease (ClpP class)|uniref:NfeD family protein n=1 Tax=Cupriavidus TaxID=106589 RepID=UPI00056AEB77|nr:nodulation protein NfeD [Cupriavidus metallidurans]AVA32936.1 serine protease [Cupriavidus metallidurans]MDE4917122.1 nodulation protein NfeD [Cupriavidus metallidurans]